VTKPWRSAEERDALVEQMHDDGMSYSAIARRLGVTPGALYQWTSRHRKKSAAAREGFPRMLDREIARLEGRLKQLRELRALYYRDTDAPEPEEGG
jgi:transposase-like protein